MSTTKNILLLLALLLLCCTEIFYPGNTRATATEPNYYKTRRLQTVNLIRADSLDPEINAIITIHDDWAKSDSSIKIQKGVYQVQSPDFIGKVGRSYWIEMLTTNRTKYESTPELIKNRVIVDSIYGETDKILRNDDTIF